MRVTKGQMQRADGMESFEAGDEPIMDRADDDQIVERLRWTPKQRLDYLLDMLAFEERARQARRVS